MVREGMGWEGGESTLVLGTLPKSKQVCGAGPVADSTQIARNHHSCSRAPGTDNPGECKTDGNRRGG
eukprot:920757-Rhodomonas_salina.1